MNETRLLIEKYCLIVPKMICEIHNQQISTSGI